MLFYCPKDYKNGKYYFNRYDEKDLLLMVPSVLLGTYIGVNAISAMGDGNFYIELAKMVGGMSIVGAAWLLFTPVLHYHNLLNFLIVRIRFMIKNRQYIWYGFDFNNYAEETLDE